MSKKPKKGAAPLKRTKKQQAEIELREANRVKLQEAQQLAQMVNLHMAGYTFEQIGSAIGATADEVEKRFTNDTARFVRTQPALRAYVRNFISGKYTALLNATWKDAVDTKSDTQLDSQDRAIKVLDRMAKLHGANAPVQTEITVDAAPEAVERLVQALSTAAGFGYDTSVFDVVDAEVVEDAVAQSAEALEVSGNQVEEPIEGETL